MGFSDLSLNTALRAYSGLSEVEVARPFFTYILRCSDRSYYVGHTDEIERRLAEHETGATSGYTAARRPVQLVWFQEFLTREEAKAAEAQIKKWSRRKKEALIGGRMEELRAAARKDWVSYRQRRALR
jgi:predicted GIY-YIG superfamily endonuclease